MSENYYPNIIGILHFKDGTYEVYPNEQTPPAVIYYHSDLTTELAEALEDLIASGTDDKHAMKQAKAALKKAGR